MSSARLLGEVWLHWDNSSLSNQFVSGKLMHNLLAGSGLFGFDSINFPTLPVNRHRDWQTDSSLAVPGPHPH